MLLDINNVNIANYADRNAQRESIACLLFRTGEYY